MLKVKMILTDSTNKSVSITNLKPNRYNTFYVTFGSFLNDGWELEYPDISKKYLENLIFERIHMHKGAKSYYITISELEDDIDDENRLEHIEDMLEEILYKLNM